MKILLLIASISLLNCSNNLAGHILGAFSTEGDPSKIGIHTKPKQKCWNTVYEDFTVMTCDFKDGIVRDTTWKEL